MPTAVSKTSPLTKFAPGLATLLSYQRSDFPHDVLAGLSVAAVALPVGVAYAQLTGFNPAVGLYSSILPLFAYAIFGTSRQLIIGPDAAACAIVAAAVTPLAAGDQQLYESLSVALALLAGLFCIGASFLKLGALADFLSKPILVGFLNGVALSIMLGQLGKIFGFSINSGGIVPRLWEFAGKLGQTHWPTLSVGLGTFVILLVTPKLFRRVPAPLVAMMLSAVAVRVFDLERQGVKIVGQVPAGLPDLRMPHVPLHLISGLVGDAAGLALVCFSSMMLTSRGFAAKNKYDVDVDREFAALGAANIASAISEGFAVSGAGSRTAMNDATGGRTQMTGLIAGMAIASVLLFFTGPFRYVPVAAMGAVLVQAGLSLVDLGSLRDIRVLDRREFGLSILATLGVVAVGAVQAILVAVVLALLRFVRVVSHPTIEVLGKLEGFPGFHSTERHPNALTIPGLLLLRFNAPLVFFNAPYFKRQLLSAADAVGPSLKWLVLDMIPITMIDATGLCTAQEVAAILQERGVMMVAAGRQTEWRLWAEHRDLPKLGPRIRIYPTLRRAVMAFRQAAPCDKVHRCADDPYGGITLARPSKESS